MNDVSMRQESLIHDSPPLKDNNLSRLIKFLKNKQQIPSTILGRAPRSLSVPVPDVEPSPSPRHTRESGPNQEYTLNYLHESGAGILRGIYCAKYQDAWVWVWLQGKNDGVGKLIKRGEEKGENYVLNVLTPYKRTFLVYKLRTVACHEPLPRREGLQDKQKILIVLNIRTKKSSIS